MTRPTDMSGVILAGGASSRLGTNKARLLINGESLLERTIRTLSQLCSDVVVVTNDKQITGLHGQARMVPDEGPSGGALMGIYSGLRAIQSRRAIVVACDMPLLNPSLLRYLASVAEGFDVVIPRVHGLLEPLHAVYHVACVGPIRNQLECGRRMIVAFFGQVRVRYVDEAEIKALDPDLLSFLNVNTPADWEAAQAIAARQNLSVQR